MENKTYVEFLSDDDYGDFKKGEIGYFLSSVYNGQRPYLVIANTTSNTIVLCMPYMVKIIK